MSDNKHTLIGYDELETQLSWVEGDKLQQLSDEELTKKYKEAYDLYMFFFILQNATKLLCNSVYGGFGTPSLRYYNREVARDITGEAKNACQVMEKTGQKYFKDYWPNDVEWHKELCEKFPEYLKEGIVPKAIEKDIIITCDTDSVSGNSILYYINQENKEEYSTNLLNFYRVTKELSIKKWRRYWKEQQEDVLQMTIEDFVNTNCVYSHTSENGTEYYKSKMPVANFSNTHSVFFDYPDFISRHKVTKDKWELTLENDVKVETTSDHSLIVFRILLDNRTGKQSFQKLSVKPNEVLSNDKALYWTGNIEDEEVLLDIKSCKRIGKYVDEYVYDITMPANPIRIYDIDNTDEELFDTRQTIEDTQTFFANGILVHNSNYLTFDYVFESMGLDPRTLNTKEAVDFIVYFMKQKMDPLYDKVLTKMIGARNGKNYMVFELEAIGGFGIYLAKKKYAFSILWKDGKYIADQKKLKVTGIELKQKASPKEIRDTMRAFVDLIFIKKGQITSELFFGLCKSVKDRLKTYDIPALSKATKLNKYDEYVVEDKDKIILKPKTPVGVKGSANYNHLIQKHNLQSEYPLLKNGMSIKIYYDKMGQPFAYPVEYGYPAEHVPEMSADTQIEKMLFAPIKRLVTGLIDGDVNQMGNDKMQQGLSAIFNKYKKQ